MPRAQLPLTTRSLRYRYRRDGQLLEVDECASLRRRGPRSWKLEGSRAVAEVGVRLVVTASLDFSPGATSTARLRWTAPGVDVAADYLLADEQLTVVRAGERTKQQVPPDAVLSPLLRATQGLVIIAVAAVGSAPVVVPDITDPAAPDALLRPLVGVRTATLSGPDADGLRTATYEGGPYPEGQQLVIDSDDVLVRYEFDTPQGRIEVTAETV